MYCSEVKREVHLAKELKIHAIQSDDSKLAEIKSKKFNENAYQMILLIDKFQNDSLKAYGKLDKTKFASKLTAMKAMLEKWNRIANDPNSDDQTLLRESHAAQDAQSRLAVSIEDFKSLCFDGKMLEFFKEEEENSFGKIMLNSFDLINVKIFESVELTPHIKKIRGHSDLNKEINFRSYDGYEFICVCLENLHSVVFVRDRQGVNRNTLILFLLDENKQIKSTKLMDLGEYAYFGYIRACGNQAVFSYGHNDEIRSFLCVLDENLNLQQKIEHKEDQLLVGANKSFIYTSSNSEPLSSRKIVKQSPILVYDWLVFI